jgi:hypothetical protein
MADILLGYERTDRQRVAPIVALLEARGWSVRWEPSADAGEAIEREPAAAGCIVAAWSIDSVDSPAVLAVASHGLARGILISVSIDFSRPPRDLEQAPSLALAGWTGDASSPRAQELLAAVGEVLAGAPAQPAVQPAADLDGNVRPAVAQPAELAARPEPDVPSEPRSQPALEVDAEPEAQPALALETDPEPEAQPAFALEPDPEPEFPEAHAGLESADRVLHPTREQEATRPVWAFSEDRGDPEEEPEEEDRSTSPLPPVLLRERVQHPLPPDAPPVSLARRSAAAAVGLVAGLAILGGAGSLLWMTGWPGGGSEPASEVAAVEVAPKTTSKPAVAPPSPARPQETKPREAKLQEAKPQKAKPPEAKPQEAKPQETPPPAALPQPQDKALEIEDLLGQVTPRVEELLADARRLLRGGDIGGARKVLAAPETAHSGSLTFLLAETYDPNVLPGALKGTMANPERARALYRKARDLGDGRAQDRLDALKASGWVPGVRYAEGRHSPCLAPHLPPTLS